jgi:iron complex outermembrane receptor protein
VVNTLESWGVAGTFDWELGETLALKSISGYRQYEGDFAEDTDGSPIPVELVMNHVEHRAFTQELRLNGTTFGTALDYTVGLFYLSADSVNSNRVNLPYVIPDTDLVRFQFLSDDPVPTHTKAAFAHGVYHLTEQLDFTLGVRYTDEDKTYTFSRVNPDGAPSPFLGSLDGVSGRYEGSKTDYRADVNYQWTPDVMTYLQFSTGFKGGGINPRPFFPEQVGPFDPETLDAYEIGLKSFLFDRSVRLNMAAFYNEYNDIQLTLLACPTAPCAKPTNGGDAEVKGAELEAEIHPLESMLIDASVSYLDFEYTSLNPGVTGPGVGVQLNMVTPYTPEWKYSFGAQYAIPLGNAGKITPRIDASYQSSIYTNVVNLPTNQISSYTLYNARVTWDSPNDDWQVAGEVTNLADKLYYLTKFDLSTIGAGYIAAQPGLPRQWAVTVKRKF